MELLGPNDGAALFQAGPEAGKDVGQFITVKLLPRQPTTYRLIAKNEGGQAEASVTLQLLDRPVYIVIDKLESLTAGGPSFEPDYNDGQGQAVFDKPVTEGRLLLRGRILWNDADDVRFQKKIAVRVTANGLQQIPAEADLPTKGAKECAFKATVLLTRAEDNVIRVDFPELKLADGQRNACVVRKCTKPVSGRRLHLAMIGVSDTDSKALKTRP